MAVPPSLLNSFEKFIEYPSNLEFEADSTEELLSYRKRLNQSTQTKKLLVHFLDLHCLGTYHEETEITSDSDLKLWLEHGTKPAVPLKPEAQVTVLVQPVGSPQPVVNSQPIAQLQPVVQMQPAIPVPAAFKKDPKCRFIFFHALNSRSPLRVSHEMLARTLTHHQVMAGFVDFTSVFGTQAESRGQRYCGFKTKTQLSSPAPVIPEVLGRSGRYYQICYNLRSVGKSMNDVWTIRQTVFHHQFDVGEGTALWISAKGDLEMKMMVSKAVEALNDTYFHNIGKCFASSLKIHMLHAQWCTKGWLEYIEHLEGKLDKLENELAPLMSGQASMTPLDGPAPREITLSDLQDIQSVERKSNETLMTLEANGNILSSLRDFYLNLLENNDDQLPSEWEKDEKNFSKNLRNRESELQRFETRSRRLARLAADQRNLVIKQLEFQSSKRMEDLSYSTYALGMLAQREAVAVRIITIVSLIYLPCSVVSSVFSTDIVKYQGGGGGSDAKGSSSGTSFSSLALYRWLEVTIPLTVVTLILGFFGYQYEKRRQADDIDKSIKEMMEQPAG